MYESILTMAFAFYTAEESRANRITLAFIGAIEEVLLNYASIALPHINFANLTHSPFSVERSFFSCPRLRPTSGKHYRLR